MSCGSFIQLFNTIHLKDLIRFLMNTSRVSHLILLGSNQRIVNQRIVNPRAWQPRSLLAKTGQSVSRSTSQPLVEHTPIPTHIFYAF